MFDELKPSLVELIAELRERDVDHSFLTGDFPPDRQRAVAYEVIELFGHRPDSWRIDPTEHPFASGAGRDDVRITTNYHPDRLESLFSTMHEYGHGLYSHQQPKHLERLRPAARARSGSTSRRAGSGRTSSAAAAPSGSSSIHACRRRTPSSWATSTSSASMRGSTPSGRA